jgi:Holliday junction DNA helicase RuvB
MVNFFIGIFIFFALVLVLKSAGLLKHREKQDIEIIEEPTNSLPTVARTEYPCTLEEYIGHRKVKEELKIILENYKNYGTRVDHILFEGGGGLGKTNLSEIIANIIGRGYAANIGESLKNSKMVDNIVLNLPEGAVWFIDEIHNISLDVAEYLYPVMEKGKLFKKDGSIIDLPNITIIGATTNSEDLPDPMQQRFTYKFHLESYDQADLESILYNCLPSDVDEIEPEACGLIARLCQGTVRKARNEWLKACTNVAINRNMGTITSEIVRYVVYLRGVDEATGLTKLQTLVLEALRDGIAIGERNLALKVGINSKKLSENVEPFLLQQRYIDRTTRGRVITEKGLAVVNRLF